MNYRERMREYLKEPDEYSSQYGKWGILNREQRQMITRLLNEMDNADEVIKHQFFEIERLKKREQECIDHYLVQCKYASEMEDKYISANYIINELEKWLEEQLMYFNDNNKEGGFSTNVEDLEMVIEKLQELKGENKE